MAYSTSAPPVLVSPSFDNSANTNSLWTYKSLDALTDVRVSGYITNGGALGMKVGDIVFVTDTDAATVAIAVCRVVSVSSTAPGAVDLTDGNTTVTGTNSD